MRSTLATVALSMLLLAMASRSVAELDAESSSAIVIVPQNVSGKPFAMGMP